MENLFDDFERDEEVLDALASKCKRGSQPKVFEQDEYLLCKLPLGVFHLAAMERVAQEVLKAEYATGVGAVLCILDAIAQGEAIVVPMRMADLSSTVGVIQRMAKHYSLLHKRGRVSPVEHFLKGLLCSIKMAVWLRRAVYTKAYLPYRCQFL
jgi:hypothetical protein